MKMKNKCRDYLKEMRITHYLKNGLVFAPVIFSGNLGNIKFLSISFWGFLCFSLMCSAVYIINDIKDIEKDRLHEEKKNRPIAAGRISVNEAIVLSMVLLVVSILFSFEIFKISGTINGFMVWIAYLGVNVFYSVFGGKKVALLDVCLLSLGFYLRVLYGGVITGIPISMWLYLVVITGAFYLGFGKRRNELVKNSNSTRVSDGILREVRTAL